VPRMRRSGLAPAQKGQNQQDRNQPESFPEHADDIATKWAAVEWLARRLRPISPKDCMYKTRGMTSAP
jgi:hypothetical protein